MKENKNNTSNITFTGLLTIAFIVLKLTKVISWSWVWVLAPMWIPAVLLLVVLLVAFFVGFFKKSA